MARVAPLVALNRAALGFGRPLLVDVSLTLARGERACLVGRNGAGKSTLLKVLAGQQPLDQGELFVQPGITVAYLPQDPDLPAGLRVADYVASGLSTGSEDLRHKVDAMLLRFALDGGRALGALSGGEARRADLARVLVSEPDVLLLDEPTNHLDLATIERLERDLAGFAGALLVISHDRVFLNRLSRITLWLDRGRLRRLDRGFAAFQAWAETTAEEEAQTRHRLDRRIVREQRWLARGVTARRKRNQGRLARLTELRQTRAQWLNAPGTVKLEASAGPAGGDKVIEAEGLTKAFRAEDGSERVIIDKVSTRIRRGDRIGIIGPNGSGKTTLARLLIGDLTPDRGRVALGSQVAPLYFDQRRESLDPDASLWQTLVPDGGDSLMVGDRQRHVVSYLRDFLFEESQARQPVKSLSGGERSRLLLARLFARPSNLLVLDEPTNDLDLETLDLLVEVLEDYRGTLLLISHDRDFLDRLASGILALEGDGRVRDAVGGYSDYLRQRDRAMAPTGAPAKRVQVKRNQVKQAAQPPRRAAKLGYREQRELEGLPAEIERLSSEIRRLEAALAAPGFYQRDRTAFEAAAAELESGRAALTRAEERWLELEERREAVAST
jgi:ATP-binding cassette subfamily F protein uup